MPYFCLVPRQRESLPAPFYRVGTIAAAMRRVPGAVHLVLMILMLAAPLNALVASGSAPAAISDATPDATAWNSQRKIVRDSDGRLYAAFRVLDSENLDVVRVFRLNDDGETWSVLAGPPDATGEMRPGSLAIDGGDQLHLTWAERVSGYFQIFHAMWTGERWTPKTQVSDTPGYSGFPSVAIDLQNRLHAAWYGYDGSTYQVFYRVRGVAGTWEPTEVVSAGLKDANNPAIAIGPDGRPHVAWFLFEGGRLTIVYTHREAEWSTATTLSDPSASSFDASLAITSGGRIFAAWAEQYPNTTRAIVVRHRDAEGWSPPAPLAWFSAPGGHPTIAIDGESRAFVFWDQLDDAIRYRVFNDSWEGTQSLSANGTASFPSVRWSAVANPLFTGANVLDVAWTEEVNGESVVVVSSVPVKPAGQRPADSPGLSLPFLIAAGLAMGGVLWLVYRRNRFLTRRP